LTSTIAWGRRPSAGFAGAGTGLCH
jgi:hypothetical protein